MQLLERMHEFRTMLCPKGQQHAQNSAKLRKDVIHSLKESAWVPIT